MSNRIHIVREYRSDSKTERISVPSINATRDAVPGPEAKKSFCASNEKLKEIRRMFKKTGKLWEDPDFPATIKSVYPSTPDRKLEWRRPHQLCATPVLFSGGASRFDVRQGELGDCWVLAAVASLSMNQALFENVVPTDQDFDCLYCGAFLFRFWQFGEWVDVIVDDRLPVERKKLMFMQSADQSEFWSALLEKAYAKVNRSYEALIGGAQSEAMEDFTGGLCEVIDLTSDKIPKNLYERIDKCLKMSSLIGCSIDAEEEEIENNLANGLIIGHAYSLTDAKEITYKGETFRLLRVRNPWGDDSEWNGDWCDESPQWKEFSERDRAKLGIVFDDDGEFWMSYEDFMDNFTKLEICYLGPESLNASEMTVGKKKKTRWEMTVKTGSWQKNVNAGGCRNNPDSFWTNPQFQIEVTDPDDSDDLDKGTLIIGLMQKDMRKRSLDFWTIGYSIYGMPAKCNGTLDKKFFMSNKMVDKSPQYINQREIVGRHSLAPGRYVIIPTTFKSNEEADFVIRIFSEKACDSVELDLKNEIKPMKVKLGIEEKSEEERRLEVLKKVFEEVSGPRQSINALQLKDILNSALARDVKAFRGFNSEVCRSMIALMDQNDLSGRMEYDEFSLLWNQLVLWKRIFLEYDKDSSGTFDAFELREALTATGFRVSNKIFTALANRYTDPENGVITFEDFILLIIRLKKSFEYFKSRPKDSSGRGLLSEEEFLSASLYV